MEEQRGRNSARLIKDAGMIAGIFLISLLIYWPALQGDLLWDDPAHVTRPELRTWEGLARIWFEIGATQEYYPILHSAFWLEHRLWGDSTAAYHVLNILLHATNCVLLACLLRLLWSRPANAPEPANPSRRVPPNTEWLAALLLAVHPVCVESVAWITEQKNTLSSVFYLLAAIGYLDFTARRRRWVYWLALGCFLLALGAKPMTVTLPAALLVVAWWKQGSLQWKRDVAPLGPWFIAAIAAGLLTNWVEGHFVGAAIVAAPLTLLDRCLLAARIFWFSLGKILWPANLTFFYELWDVPAETMGWLGYLLAGLAVTAALYFLSRRTRGPLAAWLLYGGTLFPVLGFFNVYGFSFSYVADHFQYLAVPVVIAGAAVVFAGGVARLPENLRSTGRILIGILVVVLGVMSHRQSRQYLNNETLFRANIAENPHSWFGHHILAHTLNNKSAEHRNEAIELYHTAIKLKPANWNSHYKLGLLLVERADTRDEGIAHYREALRFRPDFPEALNSLANELFARPGELDEAIRLYEKALQLNPRFGLAHANLAHVLALVPARHNDAFRHFEEALRLMPNDDVAHFNLANLLANTPGRESEAIPHYEAVLNRQPNSHEAHTSLGYVYAKTGRPNEARLHWQRALQLKPDFEPAKQSLQWLEENRKH